MPSKDIAIYYITQEKKVGEPTKSKWVDVGLPRVDEHDAWDTLEEFKARTVHQYRVVSRKIVTTDTVSKKRPQTPRMSGFYPLGGNNNPPGKNV